MGMQAIIKLSLQPEGLKTCAIKSVGEMVPSQLSLQTPPGLGGQEPPGVRRTGDDPRHPLMPWLTSGSRFSGGCCTGGLSAAQVCPGCRGGSRRAGVRQGAAVGMPLPGP